jgi:hypothetical protein
VLVKTTRGLIQAVRGLLEAYETVYRSSGSLTASERDVMASTSIYVPIHTVGAVWILDILFGCLKYKVFIFFKKILFYYRTIGLSIIEPTIF